MQTKHAEFMRWLQAMLSDEKHRATLRALLDQHELPVIELNRRRNSRRVDKKIAAGQGDKL